MSTESITEAYSRFMHGAAALAMLAVSCAPSQTPPPSTLASPTATSAKPSVAQGELGRPVLASAAPHAPFPAVTHLQLLNGLELRVIPRKTYPLLHARLVIFSGTASDGPQVGLAALTGELLKVGGAGSWSGPMLVKRAESVGSHLEVETGRDSTQISMDVTTGDFDLALELIAALATAPRFAAPEFDKLKQRELERTMSAATASAEWAGSMVLYQQLFRTSGGAHPYSHLDATPSDLQKLSLPTCKAWYRTNVTPKNATLIIVGDVDTEHARARAQRWFAGWEGTRPPTAAFERTTPATERAVWLVDRPHSEQSQIYVAGFGPPARSPRWPAADTANQILGGGVAGRLFLDVREKRSLAYRTGSSLIEVAHGPAPIVLSAGTQTAKTAQTVQALLENISSIKGAPPTSNEVRSARRNLSTSLLFLTETVGSLARLTARLAILRRPDSYYDTYRQILEQADAAEIFEVTKESFHFDPPVIVVAGDAARLKDALSRLGEVKILDPRRNFAAVGSALNDATNGQRSPP
jgi:predicted Zn-dependent peptidase